MKKSFIGIILAISAFGLVSCNLVNDIANALPSPVDEIRIPMDSGLQGTVVYVYITNNPNKTGPIAILGPNGHALAGAGYCLDYGVSSNAYVLLVAKQTNPSTGVVTKISYEIGMSHCNDGVSTGPIQWANARWQ